ncbi:MAG: glycosyl hydrolase family 18 protein [Dehalococcoidia bacterium]
MTRRPAGGPLTPRRGGGGLDGLLERAGGWGPVVAIAGAGLLLLAVVFLIASRCGGGSSSLDANCTKPAPSPPSGFSLASRYCVTAPRLTGQRVDFRSVPLTDKSVTRGLSMYAYDAGKWTRIGPVEVSPDGASAALTQSITAPKAFAVLRRTGGDFQVLGAVPKGGQPSSDAARLISSLAPATYTPAADGSLVSAGGPATATPGAGYGMIPRVVAEDGVDAQNVNSLLADDSRRGTHVDRIAAEADRGNFDGIEIDYPAVDASYKSNFTSFAQALAQKLHASKRKLVLRLPLPRREGTNWNTFAYDWPALAKSADLIVMAAEYDQSIYRTRVQDAVRYLVTQAGDSRKLILEVTPLSEERSEQGTLRTLSTLDALSIAGQITVRDPAQEVTGGDVTLSTENINRDNGSGAQWTPQGVVTFQYSSAGDQRTVWIEDQFSVAYKLEFVQLFKLGGVQVANATADPAITNIWPAIDQYQASGAPNLDQPNPQALRPQWLADAKPIPDAANRAVITWHAPPNPGKHTLSVIVSDGTMRVMNSVAIDIKAGTPPASSATPGPLGTAPAGSRAPTGTRPAATTTRAPAAPGRSATAPGR